MILNLISSPRNVSTALMYSFAQRNDMKVIDEPFYGHYLLSSQTPHPGKDEIIKSMETDFRYVLSGIEKAHGKHDHIFVKNMAHHLEQSHLGFMSEFRNIFFIRHPRELITSFAKVIPNPQMKDIGVKKQMELYLELKKISTHQPIVVDSAQLIKNPEALLSKLCAKVGIPFQKEMLSWNKGAIPEDGIWAKYWYENVHKSTGFRAPTVEKKAFPENCTDLLNEALPYYLELTNSSLTAD